MKKITEFYIRPTYSYVPRLLYQFILVFPLLLLSGTAWGQSGFGVGIGSENMHIGYSKLRNWVPHLSYEYLLPDMRKSLYIDATMISRKAENNASYVNGQGQSVPYTETYRYKHFIIQAGFKRFLNGDADKKGILFFTGGGLSDCISLNRYTATGTDPQYPLNDKHSETVHSFGLGFLAGAQYYLKPAIIQLKLNMDLLTKKVIEYGGATNVHTDARLSVMIPFRSFE